MYGSRWITAGCGSIVLLWGDAGTPVVQLEHLKQPGDVVGPMEILHDNHAGTTAVIDTKNVVEIARQHIGEDAPTAHDVAVVLSDKPKPTKNDVEKARRRLTSEVRKGHLREVTVPTKGGEGTGYVVV